MEKIEFNYIESSCDDIEVNLIEVVESINEFKKILESGEISFEQLKEIIDYDINLYSINENLIEDYNASLEHLVSLSKKYPTVVTNSKIKETMDIKLSLLHQSFDENYSYTKSRKSAKSKKLALNLIKVEQKIKEEEAIKKFYEE